MTGTLDMRTARPAAVARPILKWAGGKTQLLPHLLPRVPMRPRQYIEPFVGGGALFFATAPGRAVLADSNPELINLYRAVADNVEAVLAFLGAYRPDEESFYAARSANWVEMDRFEAAARMLFLNRTCFNGLYRVNKKGQFNVPFGRYANPRIVDESGLRTASIILQRATIVCGDFAHVLAEHAGSGDFVFLDPPYVPISKHGDFKRYTKEQFGPADQARLADEVDRLSALGCTVVLTNSNHPSVLERYANYEIEVVATRRNINSRGDRRVGEDVIVSSAPLGQQAGA